MKLYAHYIILRSLQLNYFEISSKNLSIDSIIIKNQMYKEQKESFRPQIYMFAIKVSTDGLKCRVRCLILLGNILVSLQSSWLNSL